MARGGIVRLLAAAWVCAVVVVLVATAALPGASLLGAAADPTGELLLFALAFAAARGADRRLAVVAVIALIGIEEAMAALAGDFPGFWGAPLAGGAAGFALRERAVVIAALQEQARDLESEREAYAALSVRYERAQIASELHDIVAHAISVMVVQAGASRRVLQHDPTAASDAFAAIAAAAHEAEADLTRLVALLSDRDSPHAGGPTDLARVEELVARAAGTGLDVTLRLGGDCDGLSPESAHAVYRVVQEALTNALRYASGATIAVTLSGDRDALTTEVVNGPPVGDPPLAGLGEGRGLLGLRARVGALGGTLDAGPDGAGWRVRARLPRSRASSGISAAR